MTPTVPKIGAALALIPGSETPITRLTNEARVLRGQAEMMRAAAKQKIEDAGRDELFADQLDLRADEYESAVIALRGLEDG